jgi:DNA topoisomerase-1
MGRVPLQKPKDPVTAANDAGLTYSTDRIPGIRRVSAGSRHRYVDAKGRLVRDRGTLQRIRALVIPPKWKQIWICPSASGHLQVTARDARGRKQYRYHARYRAHREQTKFDSMSRFGQVLPRVRQRVLRDLSLPGLPRDRVLAAVVRLLDIGCLRVGNAEYVRENDSYGLTTMRNRHVRIAGGKVKFRFNGKSGQLHELELDDRKLAAVVRRCRDLPGYQLFQYLDGEGGAHRIDSAQVNQYLRDIAQQDITAKHFRTWHGTVQAAIELCNRKPAPSGRQLRHNLVAAVKAVAARLGNRPATCRKYYVHPAIIESYAAGHLERQMSRSCSAPRRGLSAVEQRVLLLLRRLRSQNGHAKRGVSSRTNSSRDGAARRRSHRFNRRASFSHGRQFST